MEQEMEPIGKLFDSITIYNNKSVELFIDTMKEEQAFYVITQAVSMAHSKGIYSLQESEILSKALRLLQRKEPPTEK